MARRQDTPEQEADRTIRYANTLSAEDRKRQTVVNRLRQRQNLLDSGVPETLVPPVSQITQAAPLDESSWSQTIERAARFAPLARSQAPSAKAVPVAPTATPPAATPVETASRYGVENPKYGQPPAADIPQLYGGSGSTTQPSEGQLFQPQFFANDKSGKRVDVTHKTLSQTPGDDPRLDPLYAASVFRNAGNEDVAKAYEKYAGQLASGGQKFVTFAPGAPTATPWNAPSSPVAPSPANAYALGYSGEPSAIRAKPFGERTPYEAGYLQGYDVPTVERPAPPTLGYRVGAALTSGAKYVAGLFGNRSAASTVNATPTGPGVAPTPAVNPGEAGASRSQAARIQQPTQASPVPITPTTPAQNIDEGNASIASTIQKTIPDEWKNKRYEFAGF